MGIKNINLGLTLLVVSSIIFGSAWISASVYSRGLTGDDGLGWDRRYGIFGTALREVGTIPISLSILIGLVGLYIVVKSVRTTKSQL